MAAMPADVKDLPNASQFIIDVPGLKSRDIMIQVEGDNVLVVTGERKREEEKEGVKYVRIERPVGKFMRKFVLPENAKIDAISTVRQDGVLTVTVEKLPPPPPPPPPQPKTIEDKMPKNKRYGAYNMNEAPQEAHNLTLPNPVPAPLPLVAPPAITQAFQSTNLSHEQQWQQQQWHHQQWHHQQWQQHQWHEEQPPEVNWYVKMRSVDATSFDGMQDPSTAGEWIRKMERLYRVLGVPNEKWVSVAVPFLTELAEEWYETVKGTNGISDWTTFKQLFNKNYVPARYRVQKQREFYSLSQEDMTVREYATKFIGLLRYVPAILTDEECKVECFLTGLDYNIRGNLFGKGFKSYHDAYDSALRVEGYQKWTKRTRHSP